jgi:hypothetical protein
VKVLVCGSRRFPNPFRVNLALEQRLATLPRDATVLHGGAVGADAMADQIGKRLGLTVLEFPADWETHGRRAGIVRNLAMLDEEPDLVIAAWDGASRGTAHTMTEARKRGIPVEVIL